RGFAGIALGGIQTGVAPPVGGFTLGNLASFVGTGAGNRLVGNRIGTSADGTAAIPNSGTTIPGGVGYGVSIDGGDGMTIGAGNVISGNAADGVAILRRATNMTVIGNRIGTNAAGTAALGNGGSATVTSRGASGTPAGSSSAADRTITSGNAKAGVFIADASTTGNVVEGNFIGTNADGSAAVGNGWWGVIAHDSPGNRVGGPTA